MLLAPALALALTLGQSTAPWMTGESHPDDLEIWLVTFSPGDMVNDWWGHSAMVIQDKRLNHARLYNYGMFNFADPVTFVRNFLRGRLEFWVGEAGVQGTLEWYKSLDRDVRVQELNLLPEQAQKLATLLGTNVLPEHRDYLYHHYDDNCSTRPRDLIDQAVDGQLLAASTAPARMSLRELTRLYSMVNPPMSLLLDFMQNDRLERPITVREEAFLPDELERQLQNLKLKRPDGSVVPMVRRQFAYYTAKNRPRPPEHAPRWTPILLALGLAIGAGSFALGRSNRTKKLNRVLLGFENVLLGLVLGFPALVLTAMQFFTDQDVTYRNENVFLANIVTFAALPLGIGLTFNSQRSRIFLRWAWTVLAATSMLGVLLKLFPPFNQDNWNLIALVLPINAAMAALWWYDYRRSHTP